MNGEQRKFVWIQQAVSAVLNALVSALFVWVMFGGLTAVELWGKTGLAFDLVPTTFMITLMTAVALTLVTRAAVRNGQVPPLATSGLPLPRHLLLRAPLLALAATMTLVPLSVGVLRSTWHGDWSYGAVMIFKIAYGVMLGAIITPIVIKAALADPASTVAT
ncbi:MAG: hypothetical protein H0X36_00230 [Sphingomonadaceae bacterium]|nr:hypothetical protein [Sphingomonadaceae bacterium]